MKTIKITSRINGVITNIRKVQISDNASERFSNKIKEMREKKEDAPNMIEKLKEMNKNKSPG
jgi:hypothetical protein